MKTLFTTIAVSIALASVAPAAMAGNGNGNSNGVGNGVGNGGCPPGLMKKNPPCIPPGHSLRDYDYERIRDYDRYGLDRRGSYYRVGELIYRADPDTFKILEVIGAVDDILN